jgi:hypothetical protein
MAMLVTSNPDARAQALRASSFAPGCTTGRTALVDTVAMTVGLTAATGFRGRAYTPGQQMQIASYAQAIRRHFVPPPAAGAIPILAVSGVNGPERGLLGGQFSLIVGNGGGGRRRMAWQVMPLVQMVTLALDRAVREADDAGDLDGILPTGGDAAVDTVVMVMQATMSKRDGAIPIMQVRVPIYRSETTPAVLQRVEPLYPKEALREGLETRVETAFVIGADGQVIPETIQFTRAAYRDFVEPVRRALIATTFRPAMSGGCAVPMMVRQPFDFRIASP